MKIHPAGLEAYRSIDRRNTSAEAAERDQATRLKEQPAANESLTIDPQKAVESQLAVKGPSGSYADFLNEDERAALELLFSRFADRDQTAAKNNEAALGRLIDVKV